MGRAGRFKESKYHEAYDVNTKSGLNALQLLLIMQIGKRSCTGARLPPRTGNNFAEATVSMKPIRSAKAKSINPHKPRGIPTDEMPRKTARASPGLRLLPLCGAES